jgi:hypothetical protein
MKTIATFLAAERNGDLAVLSERRGQVNSLGGQKALEATPGELWRHFSHCRSFELLRARIILSYDAAAARH